MSSARDRRRALLDNVLSGAGSQAITAIAALWSIPQILQVVGAAGYGTYSIATALVGYLSIADLGLNNATLQRLARARATDDMSAFGTAAATSLALLGGIGVLLSIVLAAAAPFAGRHLAGELATAAQQADVASAIRWCAVGAVPVFVRAVPEGILSASEKLKGVYIASTVANLIRTVGAVAAVRMYPSPVTPVIVMVFASVLQIVIVVPIAARSIPELRLGHCAVRLAELKALLHVSLPLWVSQGVGILANQIDRIVVSVWFGLEAVGQYAIAQDLATRLWIVPYIFGRAYFPRIARDLTRDDPGAHEPTVRAYGIASVLACTIPAIPMAVFASDVLSAWTGRTDLGAAPTIFVWLAIGVIGNCSSLAVFAILQVKLRVRAIALSSIVPLAINVVGCAVLPRYFGPVGAAASWALGQVASSIVLHAFVRRYYGVSLRDDMARSLLGALIVTVCANWFARRFGPLPLNPTAGTVVRVLSLVPRVGGWCIAGFVLAAILFFRRAPWSRSLLRKRG
jgi:O-antigen/teichoic acid export membrane protein